MLHCRTPRRRTWCLSLVAVFFLDLLVCTAAPLLKYVLLAQCLAERAFARFHRDLLYLDAATLDYLTLVTEFVVVMHMYELSQANFDIECPHGDPSRPGTRTGRCKGIPCPGWRRPPRRSAPTLPARNLADRLHQPRFRYDWKLPSRCCGEVAANCPRCLGTRLAQACASSLICGRASVASSLPCSRWAHAASR